MSKVRKFSIPYNRTDVDRYMSIVSAYDKENIENIYFSLPEIDNHLDYEDEYDISKEFLRKSLDYKRIVTYNCGAYNYSDDEIQRHCDKVLFPIFEKYRIDGIIISNLNLSNYVKKNFPNLEVHLSCNNTVYTIRQAKLWIKEACVDIINPPREAGRMLNYLKELHENNIKIKVLVNNGCTFSCPYQLNHTCYLGLNLSTDKINCSFNKLSYGINSNIILPRWLDVLDEYVDIYKIAGRGNRNTDGLKNVFDIYIKNKKFKFINELCAGCATNIFERNRINIEEKDIPDKLLYCEGKYCDTCMLCRKVVEKYTLDEQSNN